MDEYGGETLSGATERESTEPLTLAELEKFFMGAWPLLEVLEMNFETDTEQILDLFQACFPVLPGLRPPAAPARDRGLSRITRGQGKQLERSPDLLTAMDRHAAALT